MCPNYNVGRDVGAVSCQQKLERFSAVSQHALGGSDPTAITVVTPLVPGDVFGFWFLVFLPMNREMIL